MGCEWLAGLVREGLSCVGFVHKIVEITAASSNNGGGQVLGLLCVGWNRLEWVQILLYTLFFSLVEFFLSVGSSHLH